jgi:hypothetical protein
MNYLGSNSFCKAQRDIWQCACKIGLPDFPLVQYTKTGKMHQTTTKYLYKMVIPYIKYNKIYRTPVKHIKKFQPKTFQNIPKLEFLVWKCAIWQPCKIVKKRFCLSDQTCVSNFKFNRRRREKNIGDILMSYWSLKAGWPGAYPTKSYK